jgi:hypothetical protein
MMAINGQTGEPVKIMVCEGLYLQSKTRQDIVLPVTVIQLYFLVISPEITD